MDTIKTVVDSVMVNGVIDTAFNYGVILNYAMVLSAFVIIQTVVRLTPTPKDDKIVNKALKVLNFIFEKTNKK